MLLKNQYKQIIFTNKKNIIYYISRKKEYISSVRERYQYGRYL